MKRYVVIMQPEAEEDLRAAFEFIGSDSPANAAAWLQGLYEAIESLDTMPQRCGFAREREEAGADVRQQIYHSHRILFSVEESNVVVHHIRHAKMDTLKKLRGVVRFRRKKRRS